MRLFACVLMLAVFGAVSAQEDEGVGQGYVVETPGTITFKVGVKIKGKVEKPQVMIFLPKERPVHQPVDFSHSFKQEILSALPFEPILD